MDKFIGKRLAGRYVIKDIIGVGGMAYVYRAYDSMDDRVVAVKILKEEFLDNEDFTRRFKNESKAIAILSHPNIVKVLDVSFEEDLQYIVMEYIDGITLKEYIDQQKVIKWKEAVHFTVQILRALQHAHDKGIVHRDIKPQNIMLLPDGTIKVTDFGIARFARTDIRATAITDKAIGSVHYISPEQARGELTDEKADIYSVGVMMYEMLTGQLPFEAESAVSVAIMQLQSEPRRPRQINPEMPEGLEDITLRAMQKDPGKRYQSAAEMLYDIDKFKQDPSIHFAYTYFRDDKPTRFIEAVHANDSYDDDADERESRGFPIWPVIISFIIVALLAAVGFAGYLFVQEFLTPGSNVEDIHVPNLIEKPYDQVVNDPQYQGKFVFVYRETAHESIPAGYIVSQDPDPGRTVKKGQTVTLTVSTGKQQVPVPDVTGWVQIEAENAIIFAGFKTEIVYEINPDVEVGKVIRTDPTYPNRAVVGSTVKLYVSTGAEPIAVPKVVDSSVSQATQTLRAMGFRGEIKVIKQNTSDPLYGVADIVMAQYPLPDTMEIPDNAITLYVSSGFKDTDDVYISLPDTESTVQLQVYIQGVLRTDAGYVFQPMLPQFIQTITLKFYEQLSSYHVLIKISVDGGVYQNYLSFTVNGVEGLVADGTWTEYPLNGVNTTTSSTTTTTQPDGGTESTTDPMETTTTTTQPEEIVP